MNMSSDSASRKDHSYEEQGSSSSNTDANTNQDYSKIYYNPFASSSWRKSSNEVDQDGGDSASDMFEITEGLPLSTIKEDIESSLFSFDIFNGQHNVYVAVGNTETSVKALLWALKNVVLNPSSTVFLIHVYPEVRLIPSPLGMLPKSQVSPELVENYIAQERAKRRELLGRYINMCTSAQVKVDTLLVECDYVPKAILDLIPLLNITKLVMGLSKAGLRKMRSKKGSGIADQVVNNAPQTCDVTVVCDGREVLFEQMIDFSSLTSRSTRSSRSSNVTNDDYYFPSVFKDDPPTPKESFTSCVCFKPRVFD